MVPADVLCFGDHFLGEEEDEMALGRHVLWGVLQAPQPPH